MAGYCLFCLCPLCPVTDIAVTVAPIGEKFCVMVHIGHAQIFFPFWGRCPQGMLQIRNFGPKFSPFDREYLENGKSRRYM